MNSKIKHEYCNLDHCNRIAHYLGSHVDCRRQGQPICKVIDTRLAEIHFIEVQSPISIQSLQEMSRLIQNRLMSINDALASGTLTLPETAPDFLKFLKEVHFQIFKPTNLNFAGIFRQEGEPEVFFGHRSHQLKGVPAAQIQKELSALFTSHINVLDYSKVDKEALIHHAAAFLEKFFRIHPFHDGNGRIGRLIVRLMARTTDQLRFKSFPEDKKGRDKYVHALQHAHKHLETPNPSFKGNPLGLLEQWLSTYIEIMPSLEEASPPEWMIEADNMAGDPSGAEANPLSVSTSPPK